MSAAASAASVTSAASALISQSPAWKALQQHVQDNQHVELKTLLQDVHRNDQMMAELEDIYIDYSRQRVTPKTMELLYDLAEAAQVTHKINEMKQGLLINNTEQRAVLHMALRSAKDDVFKIGDHNVVNDVHQVLQQIEQYSNQVRSQNIVGYTNKPLLHYVVCGIGGSYLGTEFVYEALRSSAQGKNGASLGLDAPQTRSVRFVANVDPVAVQRVIQDLPAENTLVIIISKTFTTAETMMNARVLKEWIVSKLGADAVSKHVIAVSTAIEKCTAFGIQPENIFAFWDWVGGRYSVTSAVGVLPLSLCYGYDVMSNFLAGARSIDRHFMSAPLRNNLPILLGLLGVYNTSFLGFPSRALLPYSEALSKLAPHIQQVDMESNGKRVALDGTVLPHPTAPVTFGEPGTNGQHSFYQLLHQGRTIPCDFIGFIKSQVGQDDQHDELMSNFFAQPDALAFGKTEAELVAEKVPAALIPHKTFTGNRPSTSILIHSLNAYTVGQILSLLEHRTAVEGWIWGINSFDQWGVELGKVLATKVRKELIQARKPDGDQSFSSFNSSTSKLLQRYVQHKSNL